MRRSQQTRPEAPVESPMGFQDRTALVVGGSRGLGRAVAIALAREGCRVLAAGRSKEALQDSAWAAEARGLKLATARGDVTSEAVARRLVRLAAAGSRRGTKRASRTHGLAPDILVHAAGDYWEGPFSKLTPEIWESLVRSNVTSAISVLRAALPGMRRRRYGRILFFGVAGGDAPRATGRAHAYRAAKLALLTLARSVAHEEAEHGITVNVILPGVIQTRGTLPRWANAAGKIPARRLGSPGEIARAALFLLAEESGYITGSALHVSGGYLL
jgi:NAD(P)-dependent dehydrogenase (short-subunit alcohol dehydrogenase family)